MPIEGWLYVEGSAKRRPARLGARDGRLYLLTDAEPEAIEVAAIAIAPRIGSTPRRLTLPGGRVFETADNDGVDRMFAGAPGRKGATLHWLEGFRPRLIAIVAGLALAAFASVRWGLPVAADIVAETTPYAAETALGDGALAQLDEILFKPSGLPESVQARHRALFAELVRVAEVDGRRPALHHRAGGALGANALALPGGGVVVTDELVVLMGGDPDLLAAVLAHELGHVEHRHGLKMFARALGLSLITLWLTGDVTTAGGAAAAVGETLLRGAYSRGFEREADARAVDLMRAAGRRPAAIADALERLAAARPEAAEGGYLATHPAVSERAAAARERAAQ